MSTIAPAASATSVASAAPAPPAAHAPAERVRGTRISPLARYRVYLQHRIAEEVEERMRTVRAVHVLDADNPVTGEPLWVNVRRLEFRLAGTVVRKRLSLAALFWLSVSGLALYYVAFIPYWVRDVGAHTTAEASLAQSYPLAVAILLAGAGTFTLLAKRYLRRWGRSPIARRLPRYLAGFFYIGWFFAATSVDMEHLTVHALSSVGRMLAYGVTLMVLGAAALWWGMAFTERWWDRHACMRHPDAVVMDEMARIVDSVERQPADWLNLASRDRVLQSLERIAQCLERSMPLNLRARDEATRQWLREQTAGRATAVRELKKWVCLPRADTRAQFTRRVSRELVLAASGDWDSLQTAPVPALQQKGMRTIVKTLIVLAVTGTGAGIATFAEAQVRRVLGNSWDVLRPFAPVMAPVLAPMIMYLVMRLLRPALVSDRPILREIGEILPKHE
jgi:hypothetical protein